MIFASYISRFHEFLSEMLCLVFICTSVLILFFGSRRIVLLKLLSYVALWILIGFVILYRVDFKIDVESIPVFYFGFALVLFSIFSKPSDLVKMMGRFFFSRNPNVKAVVVGLLQFGFFQLIGWHLLKTVDFDRNLKDEAIDIQGAIQTVGTVIAIVIATWQFSASAAENQYKSGGSLKLEKSDHLFFFLRLLIAPLFGIWLIDKSHNAVLTEATTILQIVGLVVILPLSAILFKEIRPDRLIKKHAEFLPSVSHAFYNGLLSGGYGDQKLKLLRDSFKETLEGLDAIGNWSVSNKLNEHNEKIAKAFNGALLSWSSFYLDFSSSNLGTVGIINIGMVTELENEVFKKIHFVLRDKAGHFYSNKNLYPDILEYRLLIEILNPVQKLVSNALVNDGVGYCEYKEIMTSFIARLNANFDASTRDDILFMIVGLGIEAIGNVSTSSNSYFELKDYRRFLQDCLSNLDFSTKKSKFQLIAELEERLDSLVSKVAV